MDLHRFFHVSFILLFCFYAVMRTFFKLQTGTLWKTAFSKREGVISQALRILCSIPLFGGVFLFIFTPRLYPVFYVPLPPLLRFLGLVGGGLSLGALGWVHYVLNDNFTPTLEVRNRARLVTWGPYRWIRHPMYTFYMVFFLCAFVLSQSWVIGLCGVGIFANLMFLRLPYEERELEEAFGEAYRVYRNKTKKFIPGLY
jgi:protein-S-isoprenylcysteine O-methyltransferase Ste14